MKIRRDVLLVILIPLLFVASIRFIMALSFSGGTLEEKLTIYDIDYQPSDFTIQELDVDYISDHEMQVDFYIIGGDGSKDLVFEVICQDDDHNQLINTVSSGSLTLLGVGSQITQSYSIYGGEIIGGEYTWVDVPSGEQIIRLNVHVMNIYLDTWSFQVDLRND
jgi:hypothetical protein